MTQPRFNLKCGNSPQMLSFPQFLLTQHGQSWSEDWRPETSFAGLMHRPDRPPAIHFAPPLLEDRETGRSISQLPAIVLYLIEALDIDCDRVDAMRIMGDAVQFFALLDTAKIETQTHNDRAWWLFKYQDLPKWMEMHNAWLHTRLKWESEATLLTALWAPLCDFFPTLWPILERDANSLHSLVTQVGAQFEAQRQLGALETRAYVDGVRDGPLRAMDDAADPPPDPIHEFQYPDWDA